MTIATEQTPQPTVVDCLIQTVVRMKREARDRARWQGYLRRLANDDPLPGEGEA